MGKEIHTTINEYLPLRDVVFQTLRQAILHGELKPGERLMEIHLAERLGVSRTPIREAIRKLELEGLVVMIPRRGAVVASITEKDLKDVLEVRRTLEILAGEVACERITPELLMELKSAGEEFGRLKETEDANRLAEADVRFHEIIYEATGNARLIHILNNLREQMYRYRLEYLKDKGSHERLHQEHREIYNGIKNGDKSVVGKAVCVHIDNQEAAILAGIREPQA
ncbi:MAG: GntR family transcriptional regulator [Lachnospiraceae bacterium]|jgi:DNA-binding GntR family transcriptional regulator|nr:GntR family transcriptional regulator [Lachnospiraceae bacterium]